MTKPQNSSKQPTEIQRQKRREYEKNKTNMMSHAYYNLKQRIPFLNADECKNLSKRKTLELATKYINLLNNILKQPNSIEPTLSAFTAFQGTVNQHLAIRYSNKATKSTEKENISPEKLEQFKDQNNFENDVNWDRNKYWN